MILISQTWQAKSKITFIRGKLPHLPTYFLQMGTVIVSKRERSHINDSCDFYSMAFTIYESHCTGYDLRMSED